MAVRSDNRYIFLQPITRGKIIFYPVLPKTVFSANSLSPIRYLPLHALFHFFLNTNIFPLQFIFRSFHFHGHCNLNRFNQLYSIASPLILSHFLQVYRCNLTSTYEMPESIFRELVFLFPPDWAKDRQCQRGAVIF